MPRSSRVLRMTSVATINAEQLRVKGNLGDVPTVLSGNGNSPKTGEGAKSVYLPRNYDVCGGWLLCAYLERGVGS